MSADTRRRRLTWRAVVALAFVLPQAGMVVRSRFAEDRFLSWAPHDRQIEYRLEASVGGIALSPEQVGRRYGTTPTGWLSHAIEDFQWTIAAREGRLPAERRATVTLTYQINGMGWKTWVHP